MGDEYVSVEHLFLALLRYPSPSMKKLFQEFGITKERFLQALSTVRGNQRVVSDNPEATYDTLNKYGEDLVEKARNQKLDPVIGRDEEIRNIIRILSRKTKNNPLLIGAPGVGKTAAIEGLAQRIVAEDVPEGCLLYTSEYWNLIEQPMAFLKTKSLWPLSLYLSLIHIYLFLVLYRKNDHSPGKKQAGTDRIYRCCLP